MSLPTVYAERVDRPGRSGGAAVRVHPHRAQVAAQPLLHVGAGGRVERPAGRAQDVVDDRRGLRRAAAGRRVCAAEPRRRALQAAHSPSGPGVPPQAHARRSRPGGAAVSRSATRSASCSSGSSLRPTSNRACRPGPRRAVTAASSDPGRRAPHGGRPRAGAHAPPPGRAGPRWRVSLTGANIQTSPANPANEYGFLNAAAGERFEGQPALSQPL